MPFLSSTHRGVGPHPTTGGGGRNGPPPQAFGGGGGGGRGDDSDVPGPAERLRRYRMGLYFTIAVSAMLLVSLTTLFFALRTSGKFDPLSGRYVMNWVSVSLPFRAFLLNTLVLLASAATAELARRHAAWECVLIPATLVPGVLREPQRSKGWVLLTLGLGVGFLAEQALVWQQIAHHIIPAGSIAARSFVYLLIGTHSLHLGAGILALVYALVAPRPRHSYETWRIVVELTGRYWHFVAVMWIYVLAVLWLLH